MPLSEGLAGWTEVSLLEARPGLVFAIHDPKDSQGRADQGAGPRGPHRGSLTGTWAMPVRCPDAPRTDTGLPVQGGLCVLPLY